VVVAQLNPNHFAPKWAPKVVVVLDDDMHVLDVNRSLAGANFASLTAETNQRLHEQLHPGCDEKCNFGKMWNKAKLSLQRRASVEWEVDDTVLGRLLRLELARMPVAQKVVRERRQQHKVLTIADITKVRQEHESLLANQQALVKLLIARNADPAMPDDQEYDETGDTGSRLMAGFVRKERSVGRQMILAQEQERKRIASELHDGVAQSLSVMKYKIEATVADLARQNPDLDLSGFDSAIEDTKSLVEEIRRITNNLAPSVLTDFGIRVALEWLCRECSVADRAVHAHCATDIDEANTPELVKIAIYRVVQEALNNVAKYSKATRVDVSLEASDKGVVLMISDNGIGFDSAEEPREFAGPLGHGMRNMRERVDASGGILDIQAARGEGVVIRALWENSELDLIQE